MKISSLFHFCTKFNKLAGNLYTFPCRGVFGKEQKWQENENQPERQTRCKSVMEKIRNKTNNNNACKAFNEIPKRQSSSPVAAAAVALIFHQMQTINCCTAKLNAFYFSSTFSHTDRGFVCVCVSVRLAVFYCPSYIAFSFLSQHSVVYL